MRNTSPTQVQSVARASGLLLLVARQPQGITATDAARACDLPVPTAHHLLGTLAAEGLVARDAARRYVLGPAAALIANSVERSTAVPEFLRDPLAQLAGETGETAYVAAWRRGEIKVLASVEGAQAVRVAEADRGPYRHAHARATGKVLLAHASAEQRERYLTPEALVGLTRHTMTSRDAVEHELAAVRARGWAEDREEFIEGVCCVSAPVLLVGELVAAFTVSAPRSRFAETDVHLRAAVIDATRRAMPTRDDESLTAAAV